jgi:3-deoxy-manno-octulosonate cytidylyltransferase (CMP-KDO synthetase)
MCSTITDRGKKVIIIPARMQSKRFPGKPLAEITPGVALVEHVYRQAKQTSANAVIVATPDREIARHCDQRGIFWRPTREDHPTGTHRCAEVFEQFKIGSKVSIIVNWQVDEPLVRASDVDLLMEHTATISTLVGIGDKKWMHDKNVTKVAVSFPSGRCHWFSRAPMAGALYHCGVYSFAPEHLAMVSSFRPTTYSLAESLEQLAWIESGCAIYGEPMGEVPLAVNTLEDLEKVKELLGC